MENNIENSLVVTLKQSLVNYRLQLLKELQRLEKTEGIEVRIHVTIRDINKLWMPSISTIEENFNSDKKEKMLKYELGGHFGNDPDMEYCSFYLFSKEEEFVSIPKSEYEWLKKENIELIGLLKSDTDRIKEVIKNDSK